MKTITVAELIQLLQQQDPQVEIFLGDSEGWYCDLTLYAGTLTLKQVDYTKEFSGLFEDASE